MLTQPSPLLEGISVRLHWTHLQNPAGLLHLCWFGGKQPHRLIRMNTSYLADGTLGKGLEVWLGWRSVTGAGH